MRYLFSALQIFLLLSLVSCKFEDSRPKEALHNSQVARAENDVQDEMIQLLYNKVAGLEEEVEHLKTENVIQGANIVSLEFCLYHKICVSNETKDEDEY